MLPIALLWKGVLLGASFAAGQKAAEKGTEMVKEGGKTLGSALGGGSDFLGIKAAVKAAKAKLKGEEEERKEDIDNAEKIARLKEQIESQKKLDKLEAKYKAELAAAKADQKAAVRMKLANLATTSKAAKAVTNQGESSDPRLVDIVLAALNMAHTQQTVPDGAIYAPYGIPVEQPVSGDADDIYSAWGWS